ncbi:unnamed protein product [Microthlaspi erraticum]|uniref:RNase H type-1 domain-containing protein n=1 Tax=Microthlaspi erraticum TaxID=1685480 RepID=A0A6D2HXW9_9BRAS|nr:unnamed protein product [Microthlaspi erraticum]
MSGGRGISALKTELEALIWAMQCMVRHNKLMTPFETDCSDLVKMVTTPEECPLLPSYLKRSPDARRGSPHFPSSIYPGQTTRRQISVRALPTDVYYVNSVSPTWIPELF